MKGQKVIVWASLCIVFLPAITYFLLSRGKNEYVHLPSYGKIDSTFFYTAAFTDQKNNRLTSKTFEGKYLVAGFYTPVYDTLNGTLNSNLRKIQNKFSAAGDVRTVSFVLRTGYLDVSLNIISEKEGALYGNWYFVSVNNDSLLRKIEKNFSISKPVDPGKAYTKLYLLDTQGRIRGIHDGTDAWAVDTLMDEIKLLRWEAWDLEKQKKK